MAFLFSVFYLTQYFLLFKAFFFFFRLGQKGCEIVLLGIGDTVSLLSGIFIARYNDSKRNKAKIP